VFFYHFQVYTEVTAALLLALVLAVVLDDRSSLPRAALFGLACGYLPWLHGKYLPFWGVAVLAFAWKERWSPKAAVGISLAGLGLLTNGLFAFHITGSLLPDSLWTLRGYERGATLFSPSTLPGLYHLFLSRDDGLFVYAPHTLLALPAAAALYRRSRPAFWIGLALIAPYVLAAASHDQGGAGGWSPPARYFVPLVPVLALALAAWIEPEASRPPRLALLLAAASASFWTAQGMLDARNYPYDRPAFLASGFLDPTPIVGTSALGLALFVAIGVGLAATADRWASSFARATLGASIFLVLGGALVSARAPAPAWVPARPPSAFRLRSTAPRFVQLPDCRTGTPRLAFRGTDGVHPVEVRGPGLETSVRVPSGTPTELPVDVRPILRWSGAGLESYRMVSLQLAEDERPVDVEAVCR
jgi:hypothetical protein